LWAAAGVSNSQLTTELKLDRGQVRLWRERWQAATPQLATVEAQKSSDRELMALINNVLSDRARLGTSKYFSTEQAVQIVALACESPQASDSL
jgi:putative transposase